MRAGGGQLFLAGCPVLSRSRLEQGLVLCSTARDGALQCYIRQQRGSDADQDADHHGDHRRA
jgi:hypothetical protein